MTLQEQQNAALARRVFEALGSGDMELFGELVHPEAEVCVMGETAAAWMRTGRDLVGKKSAQDPSRPWVYNIYYLTAQDDRVAVEVESLHRVGPEEKLYNNRYHFLFGFRDGRIVMWHEYSDTAMAARVLYNGAPATVKRTDAERIRDFYERRKAWGQDDGLRPVL